MIYFKPTAPSGRHQSVVYCEKDEIKFGSLHAYSYLCTT